VRERFTLFSLNDLSFSLKDFSFFLVVALPALYEKLSRYDLDLLVENMVMDPTLLRIEGCY